MSLKTTRRFVWIIGAAIVCAVIILAFLPTPYRIVCLAAIAVLLAILAVVCMFFLRCPHCDAQLQMSGQKFCPACGSALDTGRPAPR